MEKITYINRYGNSITFGYGGQFTLHNIDTNSLSTVPIVHTALGQHGQHTEKVTYNARTIVATLGFNGRNANKHDYNLMRWRWHYIVDCLIPTEQGMLIYQNETGVYRIACRPENLPNYEKFCGSYKRFKVDFIADDPMWKSFETFGGRIANVRGGIRYPKRYPIRYGIWYDNTIIRNNTNLLIPFLVRADVPTGCKFSINNTSTGQKLELLNAFAEDTAITIDTGTSRVKKKTALTQWQDANNILKFNSDYDMKLQPGDNAITITYTGSRPTITIEYNRLYIGV